MVEESEAGNRSLNLVGFGCPQETEGSLNFRGYSALEGQKVGHLDLTTDTIVASFNENWSYQ